LRANKWPTDKTLAEILEVDPRTIRRDLEYMREQLHAPIEFDRVRGGDKALVGDGWYALGHCRIRGDIPMSAI
jgi:HTH domain